MESKVMQNCLTSLPPSPLLMESKVIENGLTSLLPPTPLLDSYLLLPLSFSNSLPLSLSHSVPFLSPWCCIPPWLIEQNSLVHN